MKRKEVRRKGGVKRSRKTGKDCLRIKWHILSTTHISRGERWLLTPGIIKLHFVPTAVRLSSNFLQQSCLASVVLSEGGGLSYSSLLSRSDWYLTKVFLPVVSPREPVVASLTLIVGPEDTGSGSRPISRAICTDGMRRLIWKHHRNPLAWFLVHC